MNKSYSLIWDPIRACLVVASELASSQGKGRRRRTTLHSAITAATVLLTANLSFAANLPTGGSVTLGNGQIVQLNAKQMQILQQSGKLAIDWQSFDIGNGRGVEFKQPDSQSVAVNRVLGTNGSTIMGNLTANGKVYIINPNGVLFGKNAKVDVGSLVASTLAISNDDITAGKMRFNGSDQPASVVNEGKITARQGGTVALLGGQAINKGDISAKQGNVALAAGKSITLDISGDGLVNVQIDAAAQQALVENQQLLIASGGQVVLSARATNALLNTVVNNQGVIRADKMQSRGGKIVLNGGNEGIVEVAGSLRANSYNRGDAGKITVTGQKVVMDGQLSAYSSTGKGGDVHIQGQQLDVSGLTWVDTHGIEGRNGSWKLESDQITVAANPVKKGSRVSNKAINESLNTTNIELVSQQAALTVADDIEWDSANLLSLASWKGDLLLNANLVSTGDHGGVDLKHHYNMDYKLAKGKSITLAGENARFSQWGTNYKVIQSIEQLQDIDNQLAGNYVLGVNLDLSQADNLNNGNGFMPIALENGKTFSGIFSGLGNSIDNLYIGNDIVAADLGLFAKSSGLLRDVTLANIKIEQTTSHDIYRRVGGLVGNNSGAINNAHTNGSITLQTDMVSGTGATVGGLAGYSRNSSYSTLISDSSSAVNIINKASISIIAGGLVGSNNGTIQYSFATGSVEGGNSSSTYSSSIAGLVGDSWYGSIKNSYATGTVTGLFGGDANTTAAGLLGSNNYGTVSDSYATGKVTTSGAAGGLLGSNFGYVYRSYATGEVSAQGAAGGLVVGNNGYIADSYATGDVISLANNKGKRGYFIGGLVAGSGSSRNPEQKD